MIMPRTAHSSGAGDAGQSGTTPASRLCRDTPAAAPEDGFGHELAGAHSELWEALRTHRWISGLAAGTLPIGAMTCWAQQRRHLVTYQQQALAILRAAGPPEPLERWLSYLDDDTGYQRRMLAVALEALAAPVNTAEGLACTGYGSWLVCRARDGLAAGLTALYTAHCGYQHAWHTVPRSATAGAPLDAWRMTWTDSQFHQTLNRLAGSLDDVAAPGSHYQRERLLGVCRDVLQFEAAFWDMCCHAARMEGA
jgi:thiaminase